MYLKRASNQTGHLQAISDVLMRESERRGSGRTCPGEAPAWCGPTSLSGSVDNGALKKGTSVGLNFHPRQLTRFPFWSWLPPSYL